MNERKQIATEILCAILSNPKYCNAEKFPTNEALVDSSYKLADLVIYKSITNETEWMMDGSLIILMLFGVWICVSWLLIFIFDFETNDDVVFAFVWPAAIPIILLFWPIFIKNIFKKKSKKEKKWPPFHATDANGFSAFFDAKDWDEAERIAEKEGYTDVGIVITQIPYIGRV